MEEITSRANSVIKNCRSLAESRRVRTEQGQAFLEGRRLCCDAAACGVEIQCLLLTAKAIERSDEDLERLIKSAQRCCIVTQPVAEYIAQTKSSQGVFAVATIPKAELPSLEQGGCRLLLDRLQDPGNLGTILRCAEAFGITGVLLSADCADLWSPKTLRGSMGSVFRQRAAVVESLPDAVRRLSENGIPVFAATLGKDAVSPAQIRVGTAGVAVVIGNEGSGVSNEVLQSCTGCVRIPMSGRVESLNAAAAAAVLLWELSGRHNG